METAEKPPTAGTKELPLEKPIKPDTVKEKTQAQYKFTARELGELGKRLATTRKDKAQIEGQLDSIKQDYKGKLAIIELEAENICRKLDEGFEMVEVDAIVTFNDPAKGRKTYRHEDTGEFIKEEAMTHSDFQLPMFRKEEIETKPKPVEGSTVTVHGDTTTKVTQVANPTATSPNGATSIGDVLDRTVAGTEAPVIVLDLTKDDWTDKGLMKAFKKSANKAGWSDPQISAMEAILRACDGVERMIDTLRPHTTPKQNAAPAQDPLPGGEPEPQPVEAEAPAPAEPDSDDNIPL